MVTARKVARAIRAMQTLPAKSANRSVLSRNVLHYRVNDRFHKKFGAERVLRDLLEVVDNFDRALAQHVTAENLGQFKTGIELTAKEFKDALIKNGVQEVSSLGQPFNPLVHEAISSEPTNAVTEGHVTQVFKKPYKLHDKIIRLGQVVVATAMKTNNQDNK